MLTQCHGYGKPLKAQVSTIYLHEPLSCLVGQNEVGTPYEGPVTGMLVFVMWGGLRLTLYRSHLDNLPPEKALDNS